MNLSPELLNPLDDFLKQDEASLAAVLQLRIANNVSNLSPLSTDFGQVAFTVSASTIVYATRLFEIDGIKMYWLGDTIPGFKDRI